MKENVKRKQTCIEVKIALISVLFQTPIMERKDREIMKQQPQKSSNPTNQHVKNLKSTVDKELKST